METLPEDSIFAFNPPPQMATFINTDASSPLTNISLERNHLPCVVDGFGEPESCNLHQDEDQAIRSLLPSEHLQEISPTFRPFGTPGPVFYPETPISASSLTKSTAEALPAFSVDSRDHFSSYLAPQKAIDLEVTREDATPGLLDHASSELNTRYDRLSDDGKSDYNNECVFFEEDMCGLDPDRLALADTADDRYTPPVDSERPYFESPVQSLDIDVDFRFARASHGVSPAPDGLMPNMPDAVGESMAESPLQYPREENLSSYVSLLMSEESSDEDEIDS